MTRSTPLPNRILPLENEVELDLSFDKVMVRVEITITESGGDGTPPQGRLTVGSEKAVRKKFQIRYRREGVRRISVLVNFADESNRHLFVHSPTLGEWSNLEEEQDEGASGDLGCGPEGCHPGN